MQIDLTACFSPTPKHIKEIEQWLIEEQQSSGEGFYCAWSSILVAYRDHKMIVLLKEKKAVGFMTWFDWRRWATIQHTEIKPSERKKGYGRYLLQALSQSLMSKQFVVLHLHCQPVSSKKIWTKLGFSPFPKLEDFKKENDPKDPHLYKILAPHLQPCREDNSALQLKVWSVGTHRAERELPRWIWPLEPFPSGKLPLPIIAPAHYEWQIGISSAAGELRRGHIGRFGKTPILFGNFMIIEQVQNISLPEHAYPSSSNLLKDQSWI